MRIGGNLFTGIIQEMDISQLRITMRFAPILLPLLKSKCTIVGQIPGPET